MQTTKQCPLCDSENIETIHERRYRFPGDDVQGHLMDGTYVRLWILFERVLGNRSEIIFRSCLCKDCGFVFSNPRFSDDDLRIKYEAIFELGSVKHRLQRNPASNLDVRARRIYKLIQRYVYAKSPSQPRVLDYGGASGYNLIPFVDTCECGILDYEEWKLPTGVTYLGKDASDLGKDDAFDVILLLHTLEHVPDPKLLLETLYRFLKEQGLIYVEVPLGCFREWRSLDEPLTHINFFSEESLYNCFKDCGLHVLHLSTSFQWITHEKTWCLNIIGSKSVDGRPKLPTPIPTKKQINRALYYAPYLFSGRSLRKAIKKFTGI